MRLTRIALFGLLPFLLNGCIANNQSFIITGVAVVDADGDCELPTAPSEFRSAGVLDLNVARRYVMFPIVENRMVNNSSPTTGVLNGRTVIVEGAVVTYRTSSGVSLAETFTAAFGVVDVGGSLTMSVPILNDAQIAILRADPTITSSTFGTVLANVKVLGRLSDGGHVTSTEVAFPINLCRGCLRSLPESVACPADTEQVAVCVPGQDEIIDCGTYDLIRR